MIIQSGSLSLSSYRKYEKSTSYSASMQKTGYGKAGTGKFSLYSDIASQKDTNTTLNNATTNTSNRSLNQIQYSSVQDFDAAKSIHNMIFDLTFNYLLNLMFGGGNFDKDSFLNQLLNNTNGNTTESGSFSETYYESETETTAFNTTGKVTTADGREIDINISVGMSRSFEQYYSTSIDWGSVSNSALCDPLVINLGTQSAAVSDYEFYFDLDCDGLKNKINNLASGSAFLALDKNNDGIINDGSELFGTTSGDGFKDLSAYDSDGNGWIDEADLIFGSLKVWSKKPDGTDVLIPVKEAGIGAIYLGNVPTQFSLTSDFENSLNAQIRKTGVFLYENGSAGTIQHLDLVKH